MKYFLITLFFTAFLGIFSAQANTISDVRLSHYDNGNVRVVLEMSSRVDAHIFSLDNPARLVVDLKKTSTNSSVKAKKLPYNSVVKNIRFGVQNGGTARIVIDLPTAVKHNHFLLPPSQNGGIWRFVLDIAPPAGTYAKKQVKNSDSSIPMQKLGNVSVSPWRPAVKASPKEYISAPQKAPVKPAVKQTVTQQKQEANKKIISNAIGLQPFKKQQKTIMLDAGHGGKDPGAISKSGHYEKDLTLKMAFETKKLLEKAGYKVVLTRDRDIYIPLRTRVKKAHDAKADLFISIHADSTKNPHAKGLSIYTISETASDKEAAMLAESENKADILLDMDLKSYQKEVSSVLIDLAKQESMKESRRYAELVVNKMRQKVQLVPNAHRFAGFAVLKSPNVPSVLLEMGYLSNVAEEKLLQKQAYRHKLAEALVVAINEYFR